MSSIRVRMGCACIRHACMRATHRDDLGAHHLAHQEAHVAHRARPEARGVQLGVGDEACAVQRAVVCVLNVAPSWPQTAASAMTASLTH